MILAIIMLTLFDAQKKVTLGLSLNDLLLLHSVFVLSISTKNSHVKILEICDRPKTSGHAVTEYRDVPKNRVR